MANPTPATEPSAASIAQAFCEFDAMPNDDGSREVRQSLQRAADWIKQRAREIDAAPAASAHTPTTVAEVESLQLREALEWAIEAANCSSHPMHKHYAFSLREVLDGLDGVHAAAVGGDLIVHLRAAVSLGRPLLHSDVDEIAAALATPAAPVGGFVVVPRTITPEMEDAADQRDDDEPASDWGKHHPASRQAIWDAMIAASPATHPSAKDGVRGEDSERLKVLLRLKAALPDVGLNGWIDGVDALTWAIEKLEATTASGLVDGLCERLQRKCYGWGTYRRAPDAHGVNLSREQALELLRDALGVEVEIAE